MNKIYWSKLSDTQEVTTGNRISLAGNYKEPELEVRVIDTKAKSNAIKNRRVDVKNEYEILLIPKFQWEVVDYEDTNENNVEYFIKQADDCWIIDGEERKIIVKPGKEAKFEEAKKEMHKKLLAEKFSNYIKADKKDFGDDMNYIILEDGAGGYKVKISKNGEIEDMEFPWKQVRIEPKYWHNKGVGFDTHNNVEYQKEEKKSPLTTGRIIFLVALSAVLILMVVFWKKIWTWIRGEREQEKKVKEQLDIF